MNARYRIKHSVRHVWRGLTERAYSVQCSDRLSLRHSDWRGAELVRLGIGLRDVVVVTVVVVVVSAARGGGGDLLHRLRLRCQQDIVSRHVLVERDAAV